MAYVHRLKPVCSH